MAIRRIILTHKLSVESHQKYRCLRKKPIRMKEKFWYEITEKSSQMAYHFSRYRLKKSQWSRIQYNYIERILFRNSFPFKLLEIPEYRICFYSTQWKVNRFHHFICQILPLMAKHVWLEYLKSFQVCSWIGHFIEEEEEEEEGKMTFIPYFIEQQMIIQVKKNTSKSAYCNHL